MLFRNILILIFFSIIFIGVNITFFPLHFAGLQGYPRKYIDFSDLHGLWNVISSFGSLISILGLLVFVYMIYVSLVSHILILSDDKITSNPEAILFNYTFRHSYQASLTFFGFKLLNIIL